MAVSNTGLSHFHIPKGVDHFLFSSRMRFEKKSHFWGSALDSLNGKAVRSCGIWEGAMLVLGPCVSWVGQRDCEFLHREPSENFSDHSLSLTWYDVLEERVSDCVCVYCITGVCLQTDIKSRLFYYSCRHRLSNSSSGRCAMNGFWSTIPTPPRSPIGSAILTSIFPGKGNCLGLLSKSNAWKWNFIDLADLKKAKKNL